MPELLEHCRIVPLSRVISNTATSRRVRHPSVQIGGSSSVLAHRQALGVFERQEGLALCLVVTGLLGYVGADEGTAETLGCIVYVGARTTTLGHYCLIHHLP